MRDDDICIYVYICICISVRLTPGVYFLVISRFRGGGGGIR